MPLFARVRMGMTNAGVSVMLALFLVAVVGIGHVQRDSSRMHQVCGSTDPVHSGELSA